MVVRLSKAMHIKYLFQPHNNHSLDSCYNYHHYWLLLWNFRFQVFAIGSCG